MCSLIGLRVSDLTSRGALRLQLLCGRAPVGSALLALPAPLLMDIPYSGSTTVMGASGFPLTLFWEQIVDVSADQLLTRATMARDGRHTAGAPYVQVATHVP